MASNYEQLVKALRCKGFCKDCETCRYLLGVDAYGCVIRCNYEEMESDAAAAIEELQAEVERLNKEIDKRIATEIDLSNRVDALEPKRGKWIGVSPFVDSVQCSECGYCIYSEELETPYCPWCGAKMEVQDGTD